MNILVTSVGGPVAENVIQSLKLASDCVIVGTDTDAHMLQLSSCEIKALVHHASEATDFYIGELNKLYKKHKCTMLIPISDREIFVTAINQHRLPKLSIPKHQLIEVCRNKNQLYKYMSEHNVAIPDTVYDPENYKLTKPMWIRASLGAGGYISSVVNTQEELDGYFKLYHRKHKPMMSEYLRGRNFCWTGLYVQGKLKLSVTKERLGWVYNRIGTASCQRTIIDSSITALCKKVIDLLVKEFDPNMTSLMMVDLMEAYPKDQLYITEINAGRAGTVSFWFSLASKYIYGDDRANFHHQLLRAHTGQKLLPHTQIDPLPADITYTRHIDMGALLQYEKHQWRFTPWGAS